MIDPQPRKDLKLPPGIDLASFKPCVSRNEDLQFTELLLEDCQTTWRPWGTKAHHVDLGYAPDGRLVGVRIWGLV